MQCQTVCKPGSVPACAVDGYSSGTFVAERLTRPTRATTRKHAFGPKSKCCPYSVLLPVWFALPPPLPAARCALTAPFHPYPHRPKTNWRFAFCGTFPGVAPAGRYPAPCLRGARTFLPSRVSPMRRAAIRPSGRQNVTSERQLVKESSRSLQLGTRFLCQASHRSKTA